MTTPIKFEDIESGNNKEVAPKLGEKINTKFSALNDARKALAKLVFGAPNENKNPIIVGSDPGHPDRDLAAADIKKLHQEVMNTARTGDIQQIATATRTQIRDVFKQMKVGGTNAFSERINIPARALVNEEIVLDDHYMDAFIARFEDAATPAAHPPAAPAGHGNAPTGHTDGQAQNEAHEPEPILGKWSNLAKTAGVVGAIGGGTALASIGIPGIGTFLSNALTWGPVVSILKGLGIGATIAGIPLAPILGGLTIPLAAFPVFSWIRDKIRQARMKAKGVDYKAPKRGYFDRLWHGAGTLLAPFSFTKDASEAGLELSGKAIGYTEKNAKNFVSNTVLLPAKKKNMLAAALGAIPGFILGGPVGAIIGLYAGSGVKELADHTEGTSTTSPSGHDKKGHGKEDHAEAEHATHA